MEVDFNKLNLEKQKKSLIKMLDVFLVTIFCVTALDKLEIPNQYIKLGKVVFVQGKLHNIYIFKRFLSSEVQIYFYAK